MCTDDMATAHRHQPDPQVLHDFEPRVVFDLEPVDSVTVTTLMDNVTDAFMPDQGPAHRPLLPVFDGDRQPSTTMEGGDLPDVPLADGGFSVLVEVVKDGARHQILFDAGTTPMGSSRTCAASRSTRQASRPSSAATATSTTLPDSTA
jgi:7,8-dihydropterin-6-yl-methyl-4-(beta-D-ribofuranosyl)aminobenzene 5'-phosphate synthase